jgi:hypothetical protein
MKDGDRKDAYHRSFVAMRNALRSIVFHNGDCYRLDEPDRPLPCECPICLAKAALAGEEDWRFMGRSPERRDSMPREMAMHAAWKHYFTRSAGSANGTSAPMDKLLAQILGFDDRDEITERDWYVATTIVQWLATNVGQCILFDAGYDYKPPERVDPTLTAQPLRQDQIDQFDAACMRVCGHVGGMGYLRIRSAWSHVVRTYSTDSDLEAFIRKHIHLIPAAELQK